VKPQPFFLVWNPEGGTPTVKQPSYAVAEGEAKRLARNNPGSSFFVLAAVAEARKVDVGLTRFTINPDAHSHSCECDDCLPF
jgi:hypothetical protein